MFRVKKEIHDGQTRLIIRTSRCHRTRFDRKARLSRFVHQSIDRSTDREPESPLLKKKSEFVINRSLHTLINQL
jgi:hypothetical protein